MTMFQMYLIVMLDNINTGVFGLGMAMAGVSAIATVIWLAIKAPPDFGKPHPVPFWHYGKWFVGFFIIGVFTAFASSFIPTTKQMAAIILVPKLVTAIESNKKLTGLPDKIVDLADAWLSELKPKEKVDAVRQ